MAPIPRTETLDADHRQVETAQLAGVNLEGFEVAADQRWGVGVTGRCPGGTNLGQMTCGAWWAAWFAGTYGAGDLGRRMDPGLPVEGGPVVRSQYGTTMTAGADPAAAVRATVVDINFSSPRSRRRHAARWPEYRERLADLHQRVGGGGLERLDDVVSDARLMAPNYNDGSEESEALFAELCQRLDPDPARHAMLSWAAPLVLAHKRQSRRLPDPPPPGLGPWGPAADALLFNILDERSDTDPARLAAAGWSVALNPPGLDCGTKSVSLVRRCMPQQTHDLMARAARAVVAGRTVLGSHRVQDPVFTALEATLAPGYDGSAHVSAADALREMGLPDRAWWAMAHAAFWLAGNPDVERRWSWEAMAVPIALARDNGWSEIERVLRLCEPAN